MVVDDKTGVVKEVPDPNIEPPVETAYQLIVPADAVAPKVAVPVPQIDADVVPVMVGKAFTVTEVVVEFADEHVPLVTTAR